MLASDPAGALGAADGTSGHMDGGDGRVQIRLLGGFEILAPRGGAIGLRNRKACGLLAALALSPGLSVSRDKLAGLLWGESSNDAARNSLRQTLTVLRRDLGAHGAGVLDCDRAAIALRGQGTASDVEEFTACVTAVRFERAAELYRGPFLDGLFVRAAAFEEWSAGERRRLAALNVYALEQLVLGASGTGRVHLARRLLAADPLRENSHRLLAEAMAGIGERDEALRQLSELEVLLARELEVRPDSETIALRRRLLAPPSQPGAQAHTPTVIAPASPVVAVHPFAYVGEESAYAALASGLTAGVITTLSKLPYLRVIAYDSTQSHARDDLAVLDRTTSAEYLLEGTLSAAGDQIRLTAQLIDRRTGDYFFSHRYDHTLTDPFSLQDTIALKIAVAINVALLQGEQALAKLGRSNKLEAWELVLQASTLVSSHDRAVWPAARRYIDEAIRIDPDYSAAQTLLGWWHWGAAFCGWSWDPGKSVTAALEAAGQGHRLDPDNPEPFVVQAVAHMQNRNFDDAERALDEARIRGPQHAMVPAVEANVAMFAGRPAEAVRLVQLAMRLCPVYPPWYAGDLAQAHLQLGQLEAAVEWGQAAISRSAGYIHAHVFLVIAYRELGRDDEAAAAARSVLQVDPAFSARDWAAGQPFRDAAVNRRFLRALLAAGLPERSGFANA